MQTIFFPFLYKINGKETYGEGRYIELRTPKENTEINFNKAYNPYCAYSPNYSCPLVTRGNRLKIRIEAGKNKFKDY